MRKSDIRSLCRRYISAAAATVPEYEAKAIANAYGIAVPTGAAAQTAQEAVSAAAKLGYPVVVKAVSEGLLHKTEQRAVHLNLTSLKAVAEACETIQHSFNDSGTRLDGFLVEKMMPSGAEFIVGLQDDPHFGPVLMLGTGGIMIHLLDDVTFRACR